MERIHKDVLVNIGSFSNYSPSMVGNSFIYLFIWKARLKFDDRDNVHQHIFKTIIQIVKTEVVYELNLAFLI